MRTCLLAAFIFLFLVTSEAQPPGYAPADGLVAWYPLNSQSKMRDMSGHAYHGTLKNDKSPASYAPAEDRFGDPNGAINLDGYDQRIVLSIPSPFPSTFSVTGWYLTHAPDLYTPQPLFSIGPDYKHNLVELSFGPGYFGCSTAITGDSTWHLNSPPQPLLMYGWHFIGVTFDGNSLRLYQDGAEVASVDVGQSFAKRFSDNLQTSPPAMINQRTSGEADDIFIYSRALSAAEVETIFKSGSSLGSAMQSSGFTFGFLKYDTPNYDDMSTVYPFLSSKLKPKTAEAINKALQLADFNEIRAPKNPNGVKTGAGNTRWRYKIEMPTPRLMIVTTIHTLINWERRDTPDVEIYYQYYFDANSGDRLYLRDFFTAAGNANMKKAVEGGLYRYMTEQSGADEACTKYVNSSWENDRIRIRYNPYSKNFQFEEHDCQGLEPDGAEHAMYMTTLPGNTVSTQFSALGKYYFDNGPLPALTNVSHTWTGLLGTNLHVTFAVREAADHTVQGVEVYDYYGTAIQLKGVFQNGILRLDELDAKGNAVATFEARLENRKLTGTWTKADKSKTLPFTATIAGE